MQAMTSRIAIATLALAGVVATPVAAQVAPEVVRDRQEMTELRGDWVIGANVRSMDDESVGTISDLIIDANDGTVTAAVIDVGGFLGFGAKPIAVDWEELQITYDGNEVQLAITREEAEEAPEFEFRERDVPPPPPPPAGTGGGMAN
jgi:sporulation protein YlmC with PRC-barrel domain